MLKRIREARKNEHGFTLIELLIVIVILGVLAGIVVFAVNGIQDKGQKSACQSDVKTVTVASEAYYAQNGKYPTGLDDATHTATTLFGAGLIHSVPTDVTYTQVGGGASYTAVGTGACNGFTG